MVQKKVSVIVPVYNVVKYINRSIDSILSQTCRDLEIILVDDGSDDGSGLVCDEYEKKHNHISVIHKENGGLMSAWKAGVASSSAPYLCFVDSDDWIEPKMIGEMIKHSRTECSLQSREIICCNHIIDREKKEGFKSSLQKQKLPPGVYERPELKSKVFECLLGNEERPVSMSRCMKLISRELIEENLFYCNEKIKMGEDVNIVLPAILDAERIIIMKEAYYYHYYFNAGSIVHQYNEGLQENIELLVSIIGKILTDKHIGNAKQQKVREHLWLSMLVIKNEVRGNKQNGYERIKAMCESVSFKEMIKEYPLSVAGKSQKLIYAVMKNPGRVLFLLLKLAVTIYDAG